MRFFLFSASNGHNQIRGHLPFRHNEAAGLVKCQEWLD
jgi:hypothetical protein